MRVSLVSLLLAVTAEAVDPRVCALRGRSLDQLKAICQQASIEFANDVEAETLRARLFEKMQQELPESIRPPNTPITPWPGPGEPGECNDLPSGSSKSADASKPNLDNLDKMAAALFGRLDADKDGQLTREEMQGMIDSVNAAARAQGEAEHDLFKTLDRDHDGKVSRSEADETFKAMASGKASPGAQKAGEGGSSQPKLDASNEQALADGMFKSLDADHDGRLSKAEMHKVLEQYEAQAKAKGEEQSDFWTSLDANADGFVDTKEARGFFAAMVAALGKGNGKDEL
mmetsp:Transcript_16837/g.43230  ORF Transcript_16837/g.43230 Transcript_16837/m.43230 type:complete len:287 (+) Transcript_16837:40-900(+)